MMKKLTGVYTLLFSLFLSLPLSLALSGCESIYDDNSDCRTGVALRFIYDYHMEPGANSFPTNVDCVDVYVFDSEGNYTGQKFTETNRELSNENYRMELPLAPGNYHLVVYGGLACDSPTFEIIEPDDSRGSRAGHKDNIVVSLPVNDDNTSDVKLHDIVERTGGLFYGTVNLSITEDDLTRTFREVTVNLMKNTNEIQILLQELASPYEVNYEDYTFRIEDDNFTLDGYNNKISFGSRSGEAPYYVPFHAENRVSGYIDPNVRDGSVAEEDEGHPVQVASASFSTSRLFVSNALSSQLVISTKDKDGTGEKEIIRVPLIDYLLLIRGMNTGWIKDDQEFLDRQSQWSLMFFLQSGKYVSTTVKVNSWIVRLNDVSLGL